jgi:hypothetical protein
VAYVDEPTNMDFEAVVQLERVRRISDVVLDTNVPVAKVLAENDGSTGTVADKIVEEPHYETKVDGNRYT